MENLELTHLQASWDTIAEGYDAYVTPSHDEAFLKDILKKAGLAKGMYFLDVASGSGALSLPAARLGAKVMAVDLSPTMIRLLKKRAAEEGLTNVEGRQMDGHQLTFADNSFDMAGSQFGVMLFPDLPQGLREMVRVIRKGGRVLLITFGLPERVEFLMHFLEALKRVVPGFTGLPMDPPPLPFQVSKPEVLQKRMAEAGLRDIQIEKKVERLYFRSGIEMWNCVTNSNPIARGLISDLTDKQKRDVQEVLDDMLRARARGQDFAELTSDVLLGVGTK
jgi:ubiquinone/menaquinone biosynthesis C-methylase UbiE